MDTSDIFSSNYVCVAPDSFLFAGVMAPMGVVCNLFLKIRNFNHNLNEPFTLIDSRVCPLVHLHRSLGFLYYI